MRPINAEERAYHPVMKVAHALLYCARSVSLFDFTFVTLQHTAHRVKFVFLKKPPLELKTRYQEKAEREIEALREKFGKEHPYSQFALATGDYIHELIPRLVGESLRTLPEDVVNYLIYQVGFSAKMFRRQVTLRTKRRQVKKSAQLFEKTGILYCKARTQFAHFSLNSQVLTRLLNFEHLLLEIAGKISKKEATSAVSLDVVFHSLAESIALMQEADKKLGQNVGLIPYLDWYAKRGALPSSLPDPEDVSLNEGNLQEELDEAMRADLEDFSDRLLSNIKPDAFKKGLRSVLYFLEGRFALRDLLIFLMGECGIKQVADSHLFALAILYINGVETAGLELNGFGRGREDDILGAGKTLLSSVLEGKSAQEMIAAFKSANLKQNPQSTEAIFQRRSAKNALTHLLYRQLMDVIQPGSGFLKAFWDSTSQIPLFGSAATCLHLLVTGVTHSLTFMISGKSLYETLKDEFTDEELCLKLAERTVDLLYHPAWAITILRLFSALQEKPDKDYQTLGDIQRIVDFLFEHFKQQIPIPKTFDIRNRINGTISESLLAQLQSGVEKAAPSLLESALQSLIPTIKELTLYGRVLDYFRKRGVYFNGDEKFWELFIRECLNKSVAFQVRGEQHTFHKLSKLEGSLDEILYEFVILFRGQERFWECFKEAGLAGQLSKGDAAKAFSKLQKENWTEFTKEEEKVRGFLSSYLGVLEEELGKPTHLAKVRAREVDALLELPVSQLIRNFSDRLEREEFGWIFLEKEDLGT